MKDEQELNVTVGMTPRKDRLIAYPFSKVVKEQIVMYVEAIEVLKLYAIDSNIAKAASEIASLRKTSNKTLVQFADVQT